MRHFTRKNFFGCLLATQMFAISANAQWNLHKEPIDFNLQHGITQYEDGNFVQAIHTLEEYLNTQSLPLSANKQSPAPNLDRDLAVYYLTLSKIKYGSDDLVNAASTYIKGTVNPVHRDRMAYELAHHFFKNEKYDLAIDYYEMVDIKNLNNEEIADSKFELAYSYFVQSDFDNAYPLFAAIKELEDNKYYLPGNYYFGILVYNRQQYDAALTSFKRIDHLEDYEDVVPYYMAEIYYFKGENDRVFAIADKYLNKDKKLYYDKELQLLTGKVHYDEKNYKAALPYLQYYYDNSEKIRKENLYELAVTNYKLERYENAINLFKPLSNANDSLGQSSMYLLGDAYIHTNDKNGAKNAFSIASGMDYLPEVKEASHFLYAKLSYELGEEQLAAQAFRSYIKEYPNATNTVAAKEQLVTILSKSKDYQTAYEILSEMPINTAMLQTIYQRVTFGSAMQLLRNGSPQEASEMLDKSFTYKNDAAVLGAAQFWKSNLLYNEKQYDASAKMAKAFIENAKSNGKPIQAVSKEATLANAYTHLGYVQMELNQYEDAQKSFAASQTAGSGGTGASTSNSLNALLQADAAFMNKKYDEAYKLYDKAITENASNAAYPIYQKALIAGIQNKDTEKINLLQKVVKDYPKTSYAPMAQFELANTYIEAEKYEDAKKVLVDLNKSTDPTIQAKSMVQMAFVEQQLGNCDKAITSYKAFLKAHPNHQEKEVALQGMRACYIQNGNVEDYYTYTEENNIQSAGTGSQSMENDYFEMAENKYIDNKYAEAIIGFDEYLTKFPAGAHKAQALYLRAESHLELKQFKQAESSYNNVIATKDADYSKLAQIKLAKIFLDQEQYKDAIAAADEYLSTTTNAEQQVPAQLILMKAHNKLDQSTQAGAAASFLMTHQESLSAIEKMEVKLSVAKKSMEENDYDAATKLYNEIAGSKSGAASAEARFRLAEILLKQNKLPEAEKAADLAIQENQSEHYWMVKSYILIGEIMGEQKDYFNARATFQSVINNANNKELEQEAKTKLEIINKKEKANSKVSNN